MELATDLMGIRLEHPLMNAAGTCKTLEDVRKLARSATAAIMVGSITKEPRPSNSGSVYWSEPGFSVNSLGLPNPGIDYYRDKFPEMEAVAREARKPLLASVAGFSPEEYAYLADAAFEGADAVELNLGCPNVWQGSKQKRIACFDPLLVAEILRCVEDRIGSDANISVKISPFSDPFALAEVAEVIAKSELVKAVTTSNTFPNGFAWNELGKPRIDPGNGLAGMAGPALKPIALGQVRQLRALLPERIQIIGAGGINTGAEILEYRNAGASAVQIATAYLERGEEVFSQLLMQVVEAPVIQ